MNGTSRTRFATRQESDPAQRKEKLGFGKGKNRVHPEVTRTNVAPTQVVVY